jgi:hypothetical protein
MGIAKARNGENAKGSGGQVRQAHAFSQHSPPSAV